MNTASSGFLDPRGPRSGCQLFPQVTESSVFLMHQTSTVPGSGHHTVSGLRGRSRCGHGLTLFGEG